MISIIFPGTLAQALQDARILPGSRLLLHGGNYLVGDLQCTLNNVTITNYPGEQAVIIPASGYRCVYLSSVSDVTLDGLTIDGSNVSNECIKIDGNSSNIQITNCEIRNGGTHGVLVSGAAGGLEIDHCNVHDNAPGHLNHGIYLSSQFSGVVANIHHNTISNNGSNGIHAYGGDGSGEYTASYNYLTGNAEVGVGCYHGIARVYNNVIRNSERGIACRYEVVSALIAFNTGYNNSYTDIELAELSQSPTISVLNNIAEIVNISGVTITEANNATGSMTDGGGADLRLSVPVAGAAVDGITDDYAGTARANPPTIGAYE